MLFCCSGFKRVSKTFLRSSERFQGRFNRLSGAFWDLLKALQRIFGVFQINYRNFKGKVPGAGAFQSISVALGFRGLFRVVLNF